MDYLPIFADLKRRPCLVVGGNDIAWRKARMLLKAGADVKVISPELSPLFQQAVENGQVTHVAEEFSPHHLDGVFLAIAATERKAENALVYQSANQRQVLVNVVDDTSVVASLCHPSSTAPPSSWRYRHQAKPLCWQG